MQLETERLIIRKLTLNDTTDVFDYTKNPNVGNNAGWKPHESIKYTKNIIEKIMEEPYVWGIQLKSNSKVIGTIGLRITNETMIRLKDSVMYYMKITGEKVMHMRLHLQ